MPAAAGLSREEFMRQCGLTKDDLRLPANGKLPEGERELPKDPEEAKNRVTDTDIRTGTFVDTQKLAASPDGVSAKVAYRAEQLKKFRETRIATMTRELGLEDGVQRHDDLANEGNQRHSLAQSYKSQLLTDYRKKRQTQTGGQRAHDTDEL